MIEMLEKYIDKTVAITLISNEKIIGRPLQQLEDEYESFLVELKEAWTGYPKGQLMEITYDQVLKIEEL